MTGQNGDEEDVVVNEWEVEKLQSLALSHTVVLVGGESGERQALAERVGGKAATSLENLAEKCCVVWLEDDPEPEELQRVDDCVLWNLNWKRMAVVEIGASLTREDLALVTDCDELEELLVPPFCSSSPPKKNLIGLCELIETVAEEDAVNENGTLLFRVKVDEQKRLRETLSDAAMKDYHKDIFQSVFGRNNGRPWDETSAYMVDYLSHHAYCGGLETMVHQLSLNVNWVLRKSVCKPDHFDSLMEQDMAYLSVVSPRAGSILKRALRSFGNIRCHAFSQTDILRAKQIFAEFMWNKLTGVATEDRFFHMFVLQCNNLRKSLAKRLALPESKTLSNQTLVGGVFARWPILADAVDPLLSRYKDLHSGSVKAVGYVCDKKFASADSKGVLCIVDWESGVMEEQFKAHPGWDITRIAYASSVDAIITSSADSTCKLWKYAEEIATFSGHKDSVRALKILMLDQGEIVISGSDAGTLIGWTPRDLQEIFKFEKVHGGWCLGIDARRVDDSTCTIASCADDGSICVWHSINLFNVTEEASTPTRINHHTNQVTALCFGESWETLFSGSADRTICMWSLAGGKSKEPTLVRTFEGHDGDIRSVCVTQSCLFSASSDRTIKVWNTVAGTCTQTLMGHADTVNSLALLDTGVLREDADGSALLVSGSDDTSVYLWDVKTRPDDESLGNDDAAAASDASDAREESELRKDSDIGLVVTSVHSDGNQLFLGASTGEIKVYDASTDLFCGTMKQHTGSVLALSSNATYLVSGSQDYSVLVWSRELFNCVFELQGHLSHVTTVKVLDKIAVSGSKDCKVILWNIESGTRLHVLRGHESQINFISEVGSLRSMNLNSIFLTTSNDKTIRAWDVESGLEVRCMTGHTEAVQEAHFLGVLEDKEISVSFANDKTVRLWDTLWGTQLRVLASTDSMITGFAFDLKRQLAFFCCQGGKLSGVDVNGQVVLQYSFDESPHNGAKGFTSMAVIRGEEQSSPVLACSTSPDKSILLYDTCEGRMLESTHDFYGPIDNPKLSGPISRLVPMDSNVKDAVHPVCVVFGVSGIALLDFALHFPSSQT